MADIDMQYGASCELLKTMRSAVMRFFESLGPWVEGLTKSQKCNLLRQIDSYRLAVNAAELEVVLDPPHELGPSAALATLDDDEIAAVGREIATFAQSTRTHTQRVKPYLPGGNLWTRMTHEQQVRMLALLYDMSGHIDDV